jgi:uncharacterized membrane protein YbhN (UPF0104 family)
MSSPQGTPATGGSLRALLAAVLLAALGYAGFSLWAGWAGVKAAALQVGLGGLLLALACSLLNYALRFARWQAYLQALGHAVPGVASLRIYLAGFAFTPTPGKAGELARGLFLRRHGVPVAHGAAAFLSERLSDLLAVLLLALIGLHALPQAQGLLQASAALVGALVLAGALALRWPLPAGPGLRHKLLSALHATRHCHRPLLWAGATLLALLGWGAEAWAFHQILQAMDLPLGLALAAGVYAAGMLAGALSLLPGGLGGAEAVMVGLLVALGADAAQAVAATVLIRAATLWFAVAIGLAVLPGLKP